MQIIHFLFNRSLHLVLLLLLPTMLNAQIFTEKQNYNRSFPVTGTTSLEIENKYGKIHVINWQKDSVRIEVEISIKSNQYNKIRKAKENLGVKFTGSKHFINVSTEFDKNKSSFASTMKNITETFFTDNSVEINYMVYMPDFINLKVDNKYGDLFLDNHKGNLNINLSNGNIKINNVSGNTYIDHKFGNVNLGKLNTASLNGSYSEIQLVSATQLSLETKSSTINIDEVNTLKLQSRRDKVYINNINNLYGSTYFSDANFQNVSKEINLNTSYGVLNFFSLPANLEFINIISKYTDYNLFFEKGAGYSVDFHLKNVKIFYPINLYKVDESVVEKEKIVKYIGNAGDSNKSTSFRINAENGAFVITHK